MRIGEDIRLRNDINFSETPLYILNDIKSFEIPSIIITLFLVLIF